VQSQLPVFILKSTAVFEELSAKMPPFSSVKMIVVGEGWINNSLGGFGRWRL
jgi:hypothetical protein